MEETERDEPGHWYDQGSALHRQNRFAEALQAFDRGLEFEPNAPQLWLGRASALWNLNRFDEALEASDRGLELAPNEANLWLGRGNALGSLNRFDETLQAYDRGLELAPNDPALWGSRGNALFCQNRFAEALQAHDRGLELAPNDANLWLGRGNALDKLNRFDEALQVYDRGLELSPNEMGLWLGRGHALGNLNRFDEALRAYDRGLELAPNEANLWLAKAGLLARHPELKGADSAVTGQRCLYRAVALPEDRPWERSKWLTVLLNLLVDHLDSPLLQHRLTRDHPVIATLISRHAALVNNESRLVSQLHVLEWLGSEQCALTPVEGLLLRGRIELTFGDPPAALGTLDQLDDIDPANLTGQLYLAWAMLECLNDASAQIDAGATAARGVLDDHSAPARVCFDAGHLLWLGDDPEAALDLFERAAGTFLPARAMAAWCRQRHGDLDGAALHLDALLAEEMQRLSIGRRGLLVPCDPPQVDPESAAGRASLEEVFHRFECAEAIEGWCRDGTLDDRPGYVALVERLGGGLDQWMAEYDRRLKRWGELYDHRDRLKAWRETRTRAWIDAERGRLSATLDWLNTESGALTQDALVDAIAARIYGAPESLNEGDVSGAIRLLFVEHRLAADPAMLLTLYTSCRAAQRDRRAPHHVRAFATSAVTALTGAALHSFGLEKALDLFVGTTVCSVMGGVLANRVGVWLEQHRRESDEPFPRFSRFREDLLESLEKYDRTAIDRSDG